MQELTVNGIQTGQECAAGVFGEATKQFYQKKSTGGETDFARFANRSEELADLPVSENITAVFVIFSCHAIKIPPETKRVRQQVREEFSPRRSEKAMFP